jgi:hypothetical protein
MLLLGAAVAQAEPSFALLDTQAVPGALVHFSISGSEDRGTFSIEVDDEEVAEGSLPEGSTFAGAFTMPELGKSSRSVTVEARITQSDHTTTRARNLYYVVGTPAAASPPPAQALAAPTAAAPASVGQPVERSPVHHTAGKQRTRRTQRRHKPYARRRHAADPQPAGRRAHRSGRVHISSRRAHPRHAAPRSSSMKPGPAKHSTGGAAGGLTVKVGTGAPTRLTTFLTAPPTGMFSLASGVSGDNPAEFPVAALIILPLLCLTALLLVGGGFPQRPRWDSFRFLRGPPGTPRANRRPRARPVPKPVPVASDAESEAVAVDPLKAAASFPPIALAALDQRAELSTRAERKYILEPDSFESLMSELVGAYLILEIDEARIFSYDTVYFDTPKLTTYHQHLQERRRRFKCRTRRYSANGPCFFEIKLKGGRGETIKSRISLDVKEHGLLTPPALAFLEQELRVAYRGAAPAGLAPALRTSYRRLTLVSRTGGERLTFDFDLAFVADGEEYTIQPGRILLENKTATSNGHASARAGQAKRVLRQLGVRPVGSCSKYCLGVALAYPELRNNLFRPLIRRHFDPNRPVSGGRHVVPDVADRRNDGAPELRPEPSDVHVNDVGPWIELTTPNFFE